MMFLPYKNSNPTNCNNHGYRYSMSNCVFESAFEATLSESSIICSIQQTWDCWDELIPFQTPFYIYLK